MAPRLSGQTFIFGVVFFESIEWQKKLKKFIILTRKPRSHVSILILKLFNSKSKSSPSDFWLWSRVSAPGPPRLYPTSMAAACMLVPAPTLSKARRSCAVSSFSEAARKVSILGRAPCHNHYWNMRCLSKAIIAGWYHCSCVEKSESEWGDGRAPALLRKEYIR